MASDLLKIICGDALEVLKTLPSESVHTCVTSPPYW
jgi:DNA modification methylase